VDLRNPALWGLIYDLIRYDMGYDLGKDLEATYIASLHRPEGLWRCLSILKDAIRGNSVLVVGASDSCKYCLRYISSYDVVIAADGAMRCCINECGLIPDIVVTDLDGIGVDDILSNPRSIYVIHFHGDNIPTASYIASILHNLGLSYVNTVQTYPNPYGTFIFGGFTDGDRATYLAYYFGARRIGLVGFDFRGSVGRYSKTRTYSRRTNVAVKKRKLMWAYRLLNLLKNLGRGEVIIEYLK